MRRLARAAVAIAALGAACLALALSAEPPPAVAVRVDKVEAAVGDRVVATYSARLPRGTRLEIVSVVSPKLGEDGSARGPAFEFLPMAPPKLAEQKDGYVLWTAEVPFTPFTAGVLPVPGPHLVYTTGSGDRVPLRGEDGAVKVTSRLPEGQKPEQLALKDDKPVRIPARSPWFWASIAAGVLAIAGLVVWLIRRRKKTAEAGEAAPPPLPPMEELLSELTKLQGDAERIGSDPRPFYTQLTHVVKRYLERRLELPILEWTTFETLRRLRERGLEMPREVALSELLQAADLVKFGKGRVTREDALHHVERGRLLARHLEARLAPPPVAADKGKESAS